MKSPTKEDILEWATTPIATLPSAPDEKGHVEYIWQRFTKGDRVEEHLEGLPGTTFILRRVQGKQFKLVGVEEDDNDANRMADAEEESYLKEEVV